MLLHAAALRYDPQEPVKLIIHNSRAIVAVRTMQFIEKIVKDGYPELHVLMNWDTSAHEQYEQYVAFTTPGSRPVEFEYYGEYNTHV